MDSNYSSWSGSYDLSTNTAYVESDEVAGVFYAAVQAFDEEIEHIEFSTNRDMDEEEEGRLNSPCDSEDEEDECRNLEDETTDNNIWKGKTYESLQKIREEIKADSMKNGYDVRFVKSDSGRLIAACYGSQGSCEWRCHASQMQGELTFQIKTLTNHHSCSRTLGNRHATAKWVATTYADRFKSHPSWDLPSIIETVQKDFNIAITPHVARRGRTEARLMNEGHGQEQYNLLWSYADELRRTNPGTNVDIKTQWLSGQGRDTKSEFERIYVCMAACKEGLLQCGRPIICLDGCHLKGPCPGHLLTAVSIDPNDGIYPVAVAVVESECRDSWEWFLNQLVQDVCNGTGAGWTFISDRQKGLTLALGEVVFEADTRFCLRHLYANFKQNFKGKTYKDALWQAARASTSNKFIDIMNRLKNINPAAHEYLAAIPISSWATHAFSPVPKSSMGLNNLSESFNALLLPARNKPIVTMLEMIRRSLMTRIVKRYEMVAASDDLLCPNIRKKVKKLEEAAHYWLSTHGGELRFEVSNGREGFAVDLNTYVCSCYMWQLTGIPCVHAVCCMNRMRHRVELYVNPVYHRETFLRMYSHYIFPLSGKEMWIPVIDYGQILPPQVRRRPGRPKKKRVQDVDEPSSSNAVSRAGGRVTCRRCGGTGHNSRTCREVPEGSQLADHTTFMGFATQVWKNITLL